MSMFLFHSILLSRVLGFNGRRSPIGAYRRYQLGGSDRVMLCLLGGTLLAYINFQLGLWACLVELCSQQEWSVRRW